MFFSTTKNDGKILSGAILAFFTCHTHAINLGTSNQFLQKLSFGGVDLGVELGVFGGLQDLNNQKR